MTLKLNGSTNGSVSLDAPADTSPSGTDVTLTLPTSAGSSGQYLQTNGTGTLSWAGAGKIRQVVQASTSTAVTITSTTMTDSGLSGSITPTSSSNKVLVIVTQGVSIYRNDPFAIGDVKLFRDSTELTNQRLESTCSNHSTYGNRMSTMFSFCYLDSPATTSSVTYKTQGSVPATANDADIRFNKGNNLSTITLLEVEA